ncbi:HAD family hydrolase [Paenibacillus sp. 1011MAR3C5]|uniref:HAD family hydrolase n=1 Tax=Paenibacillus sp. 1011MAR3C5 TaxID=1675787 RepID=UPI000E6C698B|nr:HAD-IA family hydrolase [Paenibacillus sp. 1011MAR3C5]RJE89838.1 HAD family hydrolase [Paenibacillus sp. 1011MAR3C5]
MRAISCILFDLDGTLQDSEKLAAEAQRVGFRSVLKREATEEELQQLKGKPVAKVIGILYPEHGLHIFEHSTRYYDANCESIALYESVRVMLEKLAQEGYPMGIVSSKRRSYVLRELKANGLLSFFDCVVGQEDTEEHKPNPAPLQLAVEKMGVPAGSCIYIGDQVSDIRSASAAGMASGAALWGEGERELLENGRPDYYFTTPEEVVSHFTDANDMLNSAG